MYSAWTLAEVDVPLILAVSQLEERHRLSFWDAPVVEAARRSGTPRLVIEDLQVGQMISRVRIENPFRRGGAATGLFLPAFPALRPRRGCERSGAGERCEPATLCLGGPEHVSVVARARTGQRIGASHGVVTRTTRCCVTSRV